MLQETCELRLILPAVHLQWTWVFSLELMILSGIQAVAGASRPKAETRTVSE
jgi:hypothetical protein